MKRLSYKDVSPKTYQSMLALSTQVRASSLEARLRNLVDLRVSQINGCAYCIDMHHKELSAAGVSPEELALVCVWREAPSFTPRERAALAFAEALTTLGHEGVADDVYEAAHRELGDTGLVELALAVATINGWNRLNVAFRTPPGTYRPSPR